MTTIEKFCAKLGLEPKDFQIPPVTKEEKTAAQCLYTAVMTDTLMEEDATDE